MHLTKRSSSTLRARRAARLSVTRASWSSAKKRPMAQLTGSSRPRLSLPRADGSRWSHGSSGRPTTTNKGGKGMATQVDVSKSEKLSEQIDHIVGQVKGAILEVDKDAPPKGP